MVLDVRFTTAMNEVTKGKGRKQAATKQSSRSQSRKVLRRILSIVTTAKRAVLSLPWWADVLGVLLFAVFVYQVHRSLVPVIEPDIAVSSSSQDLPMTAKNPGDFFKFYDVQFFCDLTEQRFERDPAQRIGMPYFRIIGFVEWPLRQPGITLSPGEITSFPCNIAQNSTAKLDGVQAQTIRVVLSIRTTYSINLGLFRWHREAKSQMFTWKKVSDGYQWLPGNTLDGPN
jgi:hypothetical protein